jgi:hypothetical protein
MAGEMIAMLHGLGGGRRYGLGDIVADADRAFADMEAAVANMGGQPAPGYTGAPSKVLLPPDMQMAAFSSTLKKYMDTRNTNVGAPPINTLLASRNLTGGYAPPSSLGTDWTVYALPVGILLAAIGAAWYMTREKAL